MKYFVLSGGGLGDCFIRYFGLGNELSTAWGKIINLKRSTPCYVKSLFFVHNTAINDFIRFHPCIDEVQISPFYTEWEDWGKVFEAEGWQNVEQLDLPYEKPQLFLGPYDEECWKKLTGGKPYIVVHPYGGTMDRTFSTHLDFSSSPLPVFIIGANSIRDIDGKQTYLIESTRLAKPANVIDLTGTSNSRLACLLIARAEHFYGTFSAYAWAAIGCGTPRSIYSPPIDSANEYIRLIKKLGVPLLPMEDFPFLTKNKP